MLDSTYVTDYIDSHLGRRQVNKIQHGFREREVGQQKERLVPAGEGAGHVG
ncbi:hypothetical protein [Actinacidiphila sp. bgisy144]|uniref:hypothetical protein n=1 Tax=Actinacidiphila sp. bgisy144 TaxID=3413791 RepID=UPI003EB90EE6